MNRRSDTTNILFWNTGNQKVEHVVAEMVDALEIDILVLAEASNYNAQLSIGQTQLEEVPFSFERVASPYTPKVFWRRGRIANVELRSSHHQRRMLALAVTFLNGGSLLLFAIHFPSKLHKSAADMSELAGQYSAWIRTIESEGEYAMIVGDFNMNPFELGMIKPSGFNATLSREIAVEGNRQSFGSRFDYFYNPMWSLFGDFAPGTSTLRVPGGYFHRGSNVDAIYWNLFDGVILRPPLIQHFDHSSLRHIEEIGNTKLVLEDQGRRKINSEYSDHLPLFFSLYL